MIREDPRAGMSLIVKTVTRLVAAFIFLFGIHVVLYGHTGPGGGFAGGVIIACSFILVTLAEGQGVGLRTLGKKVSSALAAVGALIFLGTALAGMLRGAFLGNIANAGSAAEGGLLDAPVIQACEIGITLVVAMSLYMAFTVLSSTRVAPPEESPSKTAEE